MVCLPTFSVFCSRCTYTTVKQSTSFPWIWVGPGKWIKTKQFWAWEVPPDTLRLAFNHFNVYAKSNLAAPWMGLTDSSNGVYREGGGGGVGVGVSFVGGWWLVSIDEMWWNMEVCLKWYHSLEMDGISRIRLWILLGFQKFHVFEVFGEDVQALYRHRTRGSGFLFYNSVFFSRTATVRGGWVHLWQGVLRKVWATSA